MAKTKQCKYCRSEIDKKATVCPYCQKKQSGIGDAFKCVIAAIAVIIGIPLVVSACKAFSTGYNNAERATTVEVITTAEKSVSIQTGTTDSVENTTITETEAEEITEDKTEAETSEPINNVVYDDNGVKITYTGIEELSSRYELKFLIENNTDIEYCVQERNFSVNGYMVSSSISAKTAPHKKNNDSITIFKSSLAENNISDIKDIEFNFHIFDWNDWTSGFDTDTIKITVEQ